MNSAIDSDIEHFIALYEVNIEQYVLNFLGILDEFEITVYINYDEIVFTVHKDKQILYENNGDINHGNNKSIFFTTDLAVEINIVFRNSSKYREINNTFYYVLNSDVTPELDDLDDGIIIASGVYNLNIQDYLKFKASFVANFAKEILNAKDALIYKNKDDSCIKTNRILSYFYYYTKFHEIKPFQLFNNTSIKLISDSNTKNEVLKIIKKDYNNEKKV